MKNHLSLLLILLIFNFSNSYISQEINSNKYFCSIFVKHLLKRDGIKSEFSIDIGFNPQHPLQNIAKSIEGKAVLINDGIINQVFSSEIDLLSYLSSKGWKIINIDHPEIISYTFTRYLLELEN